MSYRFDTPNFLSSIWSDNYGLFTFTVREIREGLWESTISCGVSTKINGVVLPAKRTDSTREAAIRRSELVWESLDPDAHTQEVHDGLTRISMFFGWVEDGGCLSPSGDRRLRNGKICRYGIKSIEVWENE